MRNLLITLRDGMKIEAGEMVSYGQGRAFLLSSKEGLRQVAVDRILTVQRLEEEGGSLESRLALALREARRIDAYAYAHTLEKIREIGTLIKDSSLLPSCVKRSYEEGRRENGTRS